MELIMPAEISGKIMTLIDSAKEKVTIISPYNKIAKWTKLTKRILEAKQNGVHIEWFIRKGIDGNFNEIKQLGIIPIEIENLHCKIYMNETSAVVTSMNLYEYSDANSIDIGYITSDESDYRRILLFVNNYIRKKAQNIKPIPANLLEPLNTTTESGGFIEWLKEKYPQHASIVIYKNRYGNCVEIEKFKTNYRLIFEPMGNYFRIDLRVNYSFNSESNAFHRLKSSVPRWTSIMKNEVQIGNQMKRFKIDFKLAEGIDDKTWHLEAYKTLVPFFERAIDMFDADLI